MRETPAMRIAAVAAAALATAVVASGCASGGGSAGAGGNAADPPRAEAGTRISIPPAVAGQLDQWIAREATLVGDVVEIDATRVPFEGAIAIVASSEVGADGRRVVERRDVGDPATGTLTVTLTNRSGIQTVLEVLPRVQIAGARQFVAREKLVLRYRIAPGADRPVLFVATATGRAILVEVQPDRTTRGSAIRIGAEIATGPSGYEFRPSEERRP